MLVIRIDVDPIKKYCYHPFHETMGHFFLKLEFKIC